VTKRSFESINYMLRPNKNVERKLILSTLLRLQSYFDVSNYRYVGFGSVWFSDFILMHKFLGINDLVTIEKHKSRSKRVEFNKPFKCIAVRMEDASTALGEVLDDKQSIVWLDYDGPLKNALTGDIETAVGSLPSGSAFLVTVNATVDQLKNNKINNEEISPERYLSIICENDDFVDKAEMLTRNEFPNLVSNILHDRIRSAVLEKKPGCRYVPVWTYCYADDATMVTVGGMIADEADQTKISKSNIFELNFITGETTFSIDLPILTEKEKRALDKLLPSTTPLDPRKLEFELKYSEVEAYRIFYLEYPVFNEMAS
jgi:hypothetical protein